MSAMMTIYCPKCEGALEVDGDFLADRMLCPHCGNEFAVRSEGLAVPQMRRLGPGRAEMESVGVKKGSGGVFAVLLILIVLIAIVLGFVNFWVAVAVGVLGLLGAILVQLTRLR